MTATAVYHLTRVASPLSVVRQAYGAHRLFWQAFSHLETGAQPFVFRREGEASEGRIVHLLQSAEAPDFSGVGNVQAQTKPITVSLREGDTWAFRTRTCPTRSLPPQPEEKGLRSKRVPITDRQGVQQWMERKGQAHGFEVLDAVFTMGREDVVLWGKNGAKGDRRFRVTDAVFDGTLRVTDAQAFAKTLTQGIGRGKSYGYGMVSIQRPM